MKVLHKGDRGDEVCQLQTLLNLCGYDVGKPDGIFGNNTFNQVVKFQKDNCLDSDGIVGKNTWAELFSKYSPPIPYKTIPMPTANKSRAAATPVMNAVENVTGVRSQLLLTFASIESAFDYEIKAKTSSATGWFQFLTGTWKTMIENYGMKYGVLTDPTGALRKDPRISALMGAELIKENMNILRPVLKREPTDTDLYLAHFFGPGAARRFLTTGQNELAATHFPKEAQANPSIFYNKDGSPKTIQEVYNLMDGKVAAHRK
ncbi:hypothetical protein RVBP18_3640 [Pseudomonas phage sp. LC]|nr:hypothetical protein RVBP18_3640 [Pseudomonas phage sp. LC]